MQVPAAGGTKAQRPVKVFLKKQRSRKHHDMKFMETHEKNTYIYSIHAIQRLLKKGLEKKEGVSDKEEGLKAQSSTCK